MQAKKLLLGAMCTAFFGMVACTGLEPYKIDAPEDLADKIAEYQAEKEARNQGDTVVVDITHALVGAEDNTTGWWGDWSQSFEIPAGRLLHLEFINYGAKVETWNNWNLIFATTLGHGTADNPDYAERLALRADHYGWGAGWDIALDKNYIDGVELADYGDAFWADFKEKMDGAYVVMEIDRSPLGFTFITVEAQAKDGSVVSKTYNFQLNDSVIYAFITVDSSHFDVQKAYLINSKITEIEEVQPAGIAVTGLPANVSQGTALEEVLESATLVATVTFEDGTSKEVALEDVVFSAAETFATVPGTDIILYTYNKTKSGAVASTPVAGFTKVNVTTEITGIAVTKAPAVTTYYFYENTAIAFRSAGMEVTATYSNETTAVIPVADLTIADIEVKEGEQDVTITYGEFTASTPITLVRGIAGVGTPDCQAGFWGAFTENRTVASGESVSFELELYSLGTEVYHGPVAVLRKADVPGAAGEYAVVRIDNYGWGGGFTNADENKASDWNWDLFKPMLSGSHMTITATNKGDNTATIRYDVTWPNGESHFQEYKNIVIDSADAVFALTVDHCYLVIVQ